MIFTRFLDPDPPSLLAEVGKNMSSKYHKLNVAITTLVSEFIYSLQVLYDLSS